MLGTDTLAGIFFRHHIRVHSCKHVASSLNFNKNVAGITIVGMNLGLVFLAVITIGEMNTWIFLRMFATCLFFVILMDACVDLVTCYLLDYSLHNVAYSAVMRIKRRLREHIQNIVNSKLKFKNKEVSKTNGDIDTTALKEYVDDFSASRHFFVSYKNMLEYNQNSIEKAYVLSYTNPSPGNINQWSQAQHDNVGILMYKFFVSIVALLLKLPRVVHYLFVYIILVVVLSAVLAFSINFISTGPYLLLLGVAVILTCVPLEKVPPGVDTLPPSPALTVSV